MLHLSKIVLRHTSFDDYKNFFMGESKCAAVHRMWPNEGGEAGHMPDFHLMFSLKIRRVPCPSIFFPHSDEVRMLEEKEVIFLTLFFHLQIK